MSKYVHTDIEIKIGNDIYYVGNITSKVCPELGEIPDERTLNNNIFYTHYVLYKNETFLCYINGYNYTRKELINKINNIIKDLNNGNNK